ncbi:MAG: hypothetical protein ABIN58_02490 [candidate division WOR-3 bacterium]
MAIAFATIYTALIFLALVFVGKGVERTARWFLLANGLLLPFIALQMYWHWMIWVASLWAMTFPGSSWSLAVIFRRASTS